MTQDPSLADRLLRAYLRTRLRGFSRLWRLSGRDEGSMMRARTSRGAVFELSPFSYIDGIVLREGYYETEVIDAVVSNLGDGVLWDVGANFGLHGITAKSMRPSARVVCFEPSTQMAGRLRRNCALNGLEITIIGTALSNRTGVETLFLGPAGNPGMTTLSPFSGASYPGTEKVTVSRGEDLVDQGAVPAPSIIKLDVEGHELQALEGMGRILRLPSLRAVVFEDRPEGDTPIKALLKGAGFTCDALSRSENSRHSLENFLAERPSDR